MATKPKRWAVRDAIRTYWFLRGRKPRKNAEGFWPMSEVIGVMSAIGYEKTFPKCFHLPPNGGPVEIEFKEP